MKAFYPPDNIFVAPSPEGLRFKLLDFGLAKEMALDSALTQTGVLKSTAGAFRFCIPLAKSAPLTPSGVLCSADS